MKLLFFLFLCFICFQAFADLEAGIDAISRRDYVSALKEFKPLAEVGDVAAEVNLGNLYMRGLGVQQSDEQAFHWYKLAADQGERLAQTKVGIHYYHGLGVIQDIQEAGQWFLKAAKKGEPGAESILGSLYALGEVFPKDLIQAYYWYSLAINQGNQEAILGLSTLEAEISPEQKLEALRLLAQDRGLEPKEDPFHKKPKIKRKKHEK